MTNINILKREIIAMREYSDELYTKIIRLEQEKKILLNELVRISKDNNIENIFTN